MIIVSQMALSLTVNWKFVHSVKIGTQFFFSMKKKINKLIPLNYIHEFASINIESRKTEKKNLKGIKTE